ncbi:hypothetical protein B0J14DRAFT_355626 [Halenospora varia]|nr:hypothetical protein B0J14DRAFT_355626 [Halenospora varia]
MAQPNCVGLKMQVATSDEHTRAFHFHSSHLFFPPRPLSACKIRRGKISFVPSIAHLLCLQHAYILVLSTNLTNSQFIRNDQRNKVPCFLTSLCHTNLHHSSPQITHNHISYLHHSYCNSMILSEPIRVVQPYPILRCCTCEAQHFVAIQLAAHRLSSPTFTEQRETGCFNVASRKRLSSRMGLLFLHLLAVSKIGFILLCSNSSGSDVVDTTCCN